MKHFQFNFSEEIPKPVKQSKMPDCKNAWVAPNGDFYGMDGAHHLKTATYLCIFNLGISSDDLYKGTYFNETFDSKLLSLGWLSINDPSWLSSEYSNSAEYPPKFIHKKEPTQAQINTIWDYCQKHKLDYPFEPET